MAAAIGIRANPNAVHFCVLDQEADDINIRIIDKVIVPKVLDAPEQLKFIRNTFQDIINENKVIRACIRITESNAQRISISRVNIEAVLQELIASSTIEKYFIGQISSISAKLGIERSAFKPFVMGEKNFMELELWPELSPEAREAVMACFGSIKL